MMEVDGVRLSQEYGCDIMDGKVFHTMSGRRAVGCTIPIFDA